MRLNQLVSGTFVVIAAVSASNAEVFTYQGPQIVIPLDEIHRVPASVYPATITVTGTSGVIADVDVSLNGFYHAFPTDVEILLVSPAGQSVLVLSDAGGGYGGIDSRIVLILDDEAAEFVPGLIPVTYNPDLDIFSYKPTNGPDQYAADYFFPPAPPAPWGETLSVFDGFSANGVWSLYVVDDQPHDAGFINGWSLNITTVIPEPANIAIVIAGITLILRRHRSH